MKNQKHYLNDAIDSSKSSLTELSALSDARYLTSPCDNSGTGRGYLHLLIPPPTISRFPDSCIYFIRLQSTLGNLRNLQCRRIKNTLTVMHVAASLVMQVAASLTLPSCLIGTIQYIQLSLYAAEKRRKFSPPCQAQ